jgi:hypothetical protein
MIGTLYQLAWWDEHPWPAAEPHWIKLPHPYTTEAAAVGDMRVYQDSYPDQRFAVLQVTTKVVAEVKGKAAA